MKIILWKNENDRCPVKDFMEELEPKSKKKILHVLDLVEKFGFKIGPEYMPKLKGSELYEIRVRFNKKWHRIFCKIKSSDCYLLHGFSKKSDKTPKREIYTAENRAKLI